MKKFAIVSAMLLLTGCQTTTLSVPVSLDTICLALSRSNALPVLTSQEKALIKAHFSRLTKDRLKTPQSIMEALQCRHG